MCSKFMCLSLALTRFVECLSAWELDQDTNFHRETKGRFRKRVVLANVPSFRFSFPGEHANVPSFQFSFRTSECTLVPVFFGTSDKTILWENHPFGNPRNWVAAKPVSEISEMIRVAFPAWKSPPSESPHVI